MINVLQLINYPGKGGSENYILSLAKKLHNRSCKFYLGYSVDGPLIEKAKALGIQTLNIPMNSPYDFRAAKILKDVCAEFDIDVIHTHFLRENYVSVISRLIGNKAVIINTCHLLSGGNILHKVTNSLFTIFDGGLIAVSNAVKERMIRDGIDKRLIRVIYNGVDIEYWKGRRSYKVRSELGIERDDFVITSVARFSEEKGHMFILEVIKEFRRMFNQFRGRMKGKIRFILVGDGEMLDECIDFARMLGVTEETLFTGFREEIKPILHASDLFISHSRSEAIGISILEALACGLPVVATNAGGTKEVVSKSNKCGLLVEYGDVEGFAEAMARLATDREFYMECKNNAFKVVEEKFNLDKTVEDTYNLYIGAAGVKPEHE